MKNLKYYYNSYKLFPKILKFNIKKKIKLIYRNNWYFPKYINT